MPVIMHGVKLAESAIKVAEGMDECGIRIVGIAHDGEKFWVLGQASVIDYPKTNQTIVRILWNKNSDEEELLI